MPKKTRKLSTWKKRVWKLASEYNRRKDADEDGNVKCCTCSRFGHWKEFDAGHWIAKAHGNGIYFVDDGIHAQCRSCNGFREGAGEEYYPFMLEKYGVDRMEEIKALKHKILKITRQDYEEMEAEYKRKISELDEKQK